MVVRNRAKGSDLSSVGRCFKFLLLAGNVVFWLLACAVIGIGVWILVDKIYIGYVFNSVIFKVAAWMVIIGGCFIFFVAFIGCCGALRENKCFLMTYFITLIVICITLMVGGILALVFRNEIGQEMRDFMRKTINKDYGVDLDKYYHRAVTDAWDSMQRELYCCAVEDQSWSTYRNSYWFNDQPGVYGAGDIVDKPFVPKSCCMRNQYKDYINLQKCQTWMDGPPGMQSSVHENEALHYRGCYRAGINFVKDYSSVVCGLGIGVALLLIVGIVFAIVLYRQID